jgi:hypothetical protein
VAVVAVAAVEVDTGREAPLPLPAALAALTDSTPAGTAALRLPFATAEEATDVVSP